VTVSFVRLPGSSSGEDMLARSGFACLNSIIRSTPRAHTASETVARLASTAIGSLR
jgi:hypothetical protein